MIENLNFNKNELLVEIKNLDKNLLIDIYGGF